MQLPHLTANQVARFWSHVAIGDADSCWVWRGAPASNGYGQFTIGPGSQKAAVHRISYFLKHGSDPGRMFVCHSCDNRLCVNPAHLWLGDVRANARDMVDKGRSRRGERSVHAKLTEDAVVAIRRDVACGDDLRIVADRYGVSYSHTVNIVARRFWDHIP